MDGLISSAQLADYLGVPVETVKHWRKRGTGPRSLKIGWHVRYRWTDIHRWLEKHVEER